MAYRALHSIGRGGMAEVFLAHAADGSEVVIKRLLPAHRDNQGFLRMFRIEGEIGLAVRHPNVVRTVASERDADGPYLVLEYLRGLDLRSLRRKLAARGARLPLATVLYVVSATLDALHAAHTARGADGRPLRVVHRDVSPSNVILTDVGEVKLIDFGVARRDSTDANTSAGTLKGKIAYMAPEQLRHEPIDCRADVYSAGVMLYELLLGRRPYATENPGEFELMLAIVRHSVIEPSAIDPHFSDELAQLLLRSLALRVEERYASAAAFAAVLRDFASTHHVVLDAGDLAQLLREHTDIREPEAVTAPCEHDSASIGRLLGSGAPWITPDVVGSVTVLALEGNLDARFPGAALGAALTGEVLLDLHGIEHITAAGTLGWLQMLAHATRARLTFARVPETVLDRMNAEPALFGRGSVLSLEARLRCLQCGSSSTQLVATHGLGAGPEGACELCDGRLAFDERDGRLERVRGFAGAPASPELVRAARHVEGSRAVRAIDKRIDAEATRIRLRAPLPPSTRIDRLLQGIEGKLVLDLSGLRNATPALCTRFAQALSSLNADVTEVRIEACPESLYVALGGTHASGRLHIENLGTTLDCAQCGRGSALPWRPWLNEPHLCARCGQGTVALSRPKRRLARNGSTAALLAALACALLAWWFFARRATGANLGRVEYAHGF